MKRDKHHIPKKKKYKKKNKQNPW